MVYNIVLLAYGLKFIGEYDTQVHIMYLANLLNNSNTAVLF